MSVPRLVPWVDWEEWSQVRDGLFSVDEKAQSWALSVVAAWRVRGKIPFQIESTATFIDLIRKDKKEGSDFDLQARRMMYSMAVTRFVNFIVDNIQLGKYAQSISSLADRMGLPQFFVDLRHDATHSELPSIQSLRYAADRAILWLQDNYWNRQVQILDSVSQEIREQLNKYIRSLDSINTMTADSLEGYMNAICSRMSSNGVRDILIPIFIGEFLINGEELSEKMVGWRVTKWTPLIKRFSLQWPYFLNYFLSAVMDFMVIPDDYESLDPAQKTGVNLAYKLVGAILQLLSADPRSTKAPETIPIHYRGLLEVVLRSQTPWKEETVRLITQAFPDIPSHVQEILIPLSRMPEHKPSVALTNEAETITLQEFVAKMEKLKKIIQQKAVSETSKDNHDSKGWAKCESWPQVALGLLPDGRIPYLDLPDFYAELQEGHPLFVTRAVYFAEEPPRPENPSSQSTRGNADEGLTDNHDEEEHSTKRRKHVTDTSRFGSHYFD
eukprot:TRINITY_DN10077_c0_g1_i2.p1 TRINITY_DN10077_c0_g1~~TRINITY_DN10077_c0_g1_i2.p1  ORF type:complete len:498 (+),score=101.78 TRINITY_DN10077_c0_g1_i2:47-1540(+)